MSELTPDFKPVPFEKRLMIGPDETLVKLFQLYGLGPVEYRGTDPETGDEYWQAHEPFILFVAQPTHRRIIIWSRASFANPIGVKVEVAQCQTHSTARLFDTDIIDRKMRHTHNNHIKRLC